MLEKPHSIPVRYKNVNILAHYMDENKEREEILFKQSSDVNLVGFPGRNPQFPAPYHCLLHPCFRNSQHFVSSTAHRPPQMGWSPQCWGPTGPGRAEGTKERAGSFLLSSLPSSWHWSMQEHNISPHVVMVGNTRCLVESQASFPQTQQGIQKLFKNTGNFQDISARYVIPSSPLTPGQWPVLYASISIFSTA